MTEGAGADQHRVLVDAEAIRNLIASYGLLADAGDAAGVAALWIEDGEYDVGGFGIARGRDAIAALIDSPTHRQLMADGCAHVLSPHYLEIVGDRASATGYSQVYRAQGDGFALWRLSLNTWGLVRRRDGKWLVERRINRPVGPCRS